MYRYVFFWTFIISSFNNKIFFYFNSSIHILKCISITSFKITVSHIITYLTHKVIMIWTICYYFISFFYIKKHICSKFFIRYKLIKYTIHTFRFSKSNTRFNVIWQTIKIFKFYEKIATKFNKMIFKSYVYIFIYIITIFFFVIIVYIYIFYKKRFVYNIREFWMF